MTTTTKLVLTLGSIVVFAAITAPSARAACNTIPSMSAFRAAQPGSPAPSLPSDLPSDLPFRGDIGRIDRAVIIPGATHTVTLGPDPACGQLQLERSAESDPIALVIRQAHGGIPPRVVAHTIENPSTTTNEVVNSLATRLGEAQFRRSKKPLRVRSEGRGRASADGGPRYKIPAGAGKMSESVSVVVLEPHVVAGDGEITWHITTEGESPCFQLARLIETRGATGVHACVDRIYEDYVPNERCRREARRVDAIVGALFEVPSENNFRDQCDSLGDGAKKDLATCGARSSELRIGVQSNGNLLLPFAYAEIREKKPEKGNDIDYIKRKLSGRSALTREKSLASGRILLPGDEFIGSSPSEDKAGNPYKPEIDVIQPLDATAELQIEGVADKDYSILTFHPRMPVSVVCTTGEACQTFDPKGESEKAICSCPEEGRSGCSCKPDLLPTPSYFACKDDSDDKRLAGLPCTRPSHCGAMGACTEKPVCYPAGTTWGNPPPSHGIQCTSDEGCIHPDFPQCGYTLFDFASRVAGGQGEYTIEYDVASEQGGMCKGDRNGSGRAYCDSGTPCEDDIAPCLGFSLRAHGEK
jgi:hypothetical protein